MRKTVLLLAASLATGLAALVWGQGPAEAAFPGGDGQIAFVGATAGPAEDDIYAMRPDGTGLRNLTHDAPDEAQPAWPPDGRKIAFVRGQTCCAEGKGDIFVMRADGTGLRRLTDAPGNEVAPAWSPAGGRLTVDTSNACCGSEIFVTNADGTGLTNITRGNGLEGNFDPTWRPRPQR